MISKHFQVLAVSLLLCAGGVIFPAAAQASILIGEHADDTGEVSAPAAYFEDQTGSESAIQARAQFSALTQSKKVPASTLIDFGVSGSSYWLELPVTNNSRAEQWVLEFAPLLKTMPSPIKSVRIYDADNPEKPLTRWPNLAQPTRLSIPLGLPSIQTTTRYALVETWPGIQNPVAPVLKTTTYVSQEATRLAQKISLLWLVMGGVCGAGLVQLILTRQMLQGVLALNALVLGIGIFILQRSELVPFMLGHHPVVLPLFIYGLFGIVASILLWVASSRYSIKSAVSVLPILVNLAAIFIGLFNLDIPIAHGISVEKLPHVILSLTGIFLTLATIAITIHQYGLAWFIPAWVALAAMPWLADYVPFGAPIAYALFLAVAGVASVFSYWRSLDQETELLQRRLRNEMKDLKDRHAEENQSWEKKMESERFLLNELRHREQQRSAELEIARREADAANKAKSDFLAIISHEIRTPMNGIMGVVDLIRQSPLNEKQHEYVEVIKNSGDTMLTLLNDILDYSKIEKGAIDLESIPFNLRSLVNSVATLMNGRAKEKGLTIEVRIADDVGDHLTGDPSRVRQILLNLVGNAIKFTDKGKVTVTVQRRPDTDAVRRGQIALLFEIQDTGMGISTENQARLFQPYMQADASISRRFGGTGLGLNICRMLVNAMQGEIGVVSTEGQGSTFWFTLPFAPASEASIAENEAQAPAKAARTLYVLLVDDNPINLKVTAGLLELDGHQVTSVGSGAEALKRIDEDRFDVVFADMMMPEMDGKTFLTKLRENPHPLRAKLPVFALTGVTEPDEIKKIKEIGVQGVLTKPVTQNALRAALQILAPASVTATGAPITIDTIMSNLEKLSDEDKEKLLRELSKNVKYADAIDAVPPPEEKPLIASKDEPEADEEKPEILNLETLGQLRASLPAETLDGILDELIEKCRELTDQIQESMQTEDMDDLAEKAHNLKGMAGNFGLDALMKHAGLLEQHGRHNALEKAAKRVPLGRGVLEETLSQLEAWRKA